ncbi:MAG: hypothetical protein WC775_06230 [Patescibacteria group bacterium]|jgi:Neuraminidase (sialidase)
MKQLKAEKYIGDGKYPNFYWVFQYDEKMRRVKHTDDDGKTWTEFEVIENNETRTDSFLGQFETYREALACVDSKAYLPHVVIEDRLSGQVFESYCISCTECGHEEYGSNNDIGYTQKKMERDGKVFE